MDPPRPQNIALLRLSAIGDVILSLPLALGLRDAFPEARITWVVQPEAAPLLEDHPAVDATLLFPRRGGVGERLRFVRDLRSRRFDATVDPQGNLKSGVIGWLSGAPVRAGLRARDCKERINALFTNRRGGAPRTVHGVDRAWASAAALGIAPGPDRWGLAARPAELAAWAERCRAAGADPTRPLLALHLTDPQDARSWFADAWQETARGAVALGYQVLLNGVAARRPLAADLTGSGVFDLTGRDDLRGLMAQYQAMAGDPSNLLVSPDSGPMHLAVALGLPVLCLAGPQDPARTGPRRGESIHAWEGLACAPCLERKCILRPPERTCMRRISAAEVVGRISERIGRGRPRTPS